MSKAHWLALASIPGLGGATARRLLERFGDVQAVCGASPDDRVSVPRVTRAMAERLLSSPIEQMEEELLTLSDEGVELLTWDVDSFPASLHGLPDAPVVLFVRGALRASDERAVAIVGTRTPTARATEVTTMLARELASRGLTIVSGFALGIDSAAHRGALAAEEGRTVGVLGSGIRVIHPRENMELAEHIIQRGALLSELHPNAPPKGTHLMARDRIISGLSRAVIVVEASSKSGSLDTAARALKQRRAVYAVPGSEGTDQLLTSGALNLDPDALDVERLAQAILHGGTASCAPDLRQGPLW